MLLVNTRPAICFVVNILSQFMMEPLHSHWVVIKHVLGYLHGTINHGLRYIVGDVRLNGYTYGNLVRKLLTRRAHPSVDLAWGFQ